MQSYKRSKSASSIIKKVLIKAKLIVNFEKNFKNVNKEYNKENFYEANFVKVKKKNLFINK